METKQDILNEVCMHLGLSPIQVSSGSTEPRDFFLRIISLLGLPGPNSGSKPALGRSIVESAGIMWMPEYESRGSTITLRGLRAVREAVYLFVPGEIGLTQQSDLASALNTES